MDIAKDNTLEDFVKTEYPDGLTTDEELYWLYKKVGTLEPNSIIVELGTYLNRSINVILKSLVDHQISGCNVYGVNVLAVTRTDEKESAKTIFNSYDTKGVNINYELYHCESRNIAFKFKDKTVDFLLVDSVLEDETVYEALIFWHPKLKDNGIMYGHSYKLELESQIAIKKFVDVYKYTFEKIGVGDLWAISKPTKEEPK